MKRVKSIQELDILIAVHEISCSFTKLNYGLIASHKTRMGEDGRRAAGTSIVIKETHILGDWLNPGCTLMKTIISVGVFINPN